MLGGQQSRTIRQWNTRRPIAPPRCHGRICWSHFVFLFGAIPIVLAVVVCNNFDGSLGCPGLISLSNFQNLCQFINNEENLNQTTQTMESRSVRWRQGRYRVEEV